MEKIEGLDAGLLKEEVATALIASHLHESCKGITYEVLAASARPLRKSQARDEVIRE